MPSNPLISTAFRLTLLLTVVSAIGYFALSGISANVSLAELKNYIQSFGPLAPAIYILVFTLVPLTLIPNSLVAIAGGTLFGIYYGTLYTILGALFGASLSFALSRSLGRTAIEKLLKNKAIWLAKCTGQQGFAVVFMLRLIPIIPFDAISYAAGLSKIRYPDFIAATALGIVPGVLVYTNLGDKSVELFSPDFWLALVILALLVAVSSIIKRRYPLENIQRISRTI